MKKILLILLISLALALPPAGAAFAATVGGELKEVLKTAPADVLIPIIVHLHKKANLRQFKDLSTDQRRSGIIDALRQLAEADQLEILDSLKAQNVDKVKRFWLINAMAMETNPAVIRWLKNQQAVKEIRLDTTIMLADENGSSGSGAWNVGMIQADLLWGAGFTGQGAVIATMDSGVDARHNALSGGYRGGGNSWYDPNGEHETPFDADGHGTQTMGVLVGTGGMGIAPGAQWIAVKIFDDSGAASLSAIHAGFQWLLDPDGSPATNDAPDVVNNSWGFDNRVGECYDEFAADIDALRAADIGVVFAGGNSGPAADTSLSPANNPGSLAVGAVDSGGQVTRLSSSGPSACGGGLYPQLTAPGLDVLTADLTYGLYPDRVTYGSGTSIAAPHVAGALALLHSAAPGASLEAKTQALFDAAQDAGAAGPDNDYGYGLAQAHDAYLILSNGSGGGDPQCIDMDGDGFFSASSDTICGEPADCNDTDGAIFPGAEEIARDSVDQDCNGLDLTIAITEASYYAKRDKLSVTATSDLGQAALLSATIPEVGTVEMSWNRKEKQWQVSVSKATRKGFDPANPDSVAVSGEEGETTRPVVVE